MKIAVFVEGFTGLSFVRELILKSCNYTNVQIKCSLLHSGQLQSIRYSFPENCLLDGNRNYHLICCQGDAILSKIKPRKKYLIESGFTKIVGLRDIYSSEYKEYSNGTIDLDLISEMTTAQNNILNIVLNGEIEGEIAFSQMEIECWYLAIKGFFLKKDIDLSEEIIKEIISMYGDYNDIENTVYKPSTCLETIFLKVDDIYTKKQEQAETLASYLDTELINGLYLEEHTKWFTKFYDLLEL